MAQGDRESSLFPILRRRSSICKEVDIARPVPVRQKLPSSRGVISTGAPVSSEILADLHSSEVR
jgi:hypothetical protein